MPQKEADWIIVYDGTQGEDAYACECLRCGVKQRFSVPIAIPIYCAAIDAFGKIHRKCREKDKSK